MGYCELHPQHDHQAKLVLYENASCTVFIADVHITVSSICQEKEGVNCSCFCVEEHVFSTRTVTERKLWLRAIANVKVKLVNHAPSPLPEELQNYRKAIKGHISTLKVSL